MHEKYKDQGFVALGITADIEEDLPRVREFVKKKEGKHIILHDELEEAGTWYDVQGIPVTILIDKQGRVAEWHPEEDADPDDGPSFRHDGFRKGQEKVIEARIKELLAEK